MIQALYTGMNGVISQQRNLDTIASNIANLSTTGYKWVRMDFKDALYERLISPGDNDITHNLQRGVGVIPAQTQHIFHQGNLETTDRALDFAIDGEGFFALETASGDTAYTRVGGFYVSGEGADAYLVNANGDYLLDTNGERIEVRGRIDQMSVSPEGLVEFQDEDGTIIGGVPQQIALVSFDNPAGLTSGEGTYFFESENSGNINVNPDGVIRQGALEGSNVDYAYEVTRMMRAQRAYQLAARCINYADQIEGLAISIRK